VGEAPGVGLGRDEELRGHNCGRLH
jgi:hypothetical protein